jgi:hypothetical protein
MGIRSHDLLPIAGAADQLVYNEFLIAFRRKYPYTD